MIKSGKRLPAGTDFSAEPTEHRYIRARDIKAGKICLDDVAYIGKETKKAIKKYIINSGDVAITIVANIGDIGFATQDCDGINLTENAVRLTEFDESVVYSKYLAYYLGQTSMKAHMENLAAGAAQAKLGIYKIEKIKVQLPDVSIQRAAVNIIEQYDNLIEVNNKRIKILEQMAENLYKEWFVRFRFPGYETAEFENGIPKGWKIRHLSDVADVEMGQSPPSECYNNEKKGLPFHQGVGSYGELYLEDSTYSTEGKRLAEPNSIIFSVRAPVGRINITLNRIILGRGIAGINSKTKNNAFLYWQLKNAFATEDIIGNGSIFASVTKDELQGQRVLIPDKGMIDFFNLIAVKTERLIRSIYLENRNLIKQRDLLLPRLMSGKLEV